jgi:hypothetical protein
MPLVEEELLTFPEHLSSPPVFIGVRVTRSLAQRNWKTYGTQDGKKENKIYEN